MTTFKTWAVAIASDLALAAMLISWQIGGHQGVGNVFMAICWGYGVLGCVAGLYVDQSSFPSAQPKSEALKQYHSVTNVLFCLGIAYFGHFWMAGVLFLGIVGFLAAKAREPKGGAA